MRLKALDWRGCVRRIRNGIAYPFWALQLLTGAKSFLDNPLIGSPALNERGLHVARQALAHRAASYRRRSLERFVPPELVAAFERDGFVLVRDVLPPDEFARLVEEVRRYRGPARETTQGDTITRRLALDPAALTAMPSVRRFLDLSLWRRLLRLVGSQDAEPICYLQTILLQAVPGDPDPQTALHADTFHPTVKAWFALTDVAEDGGPFTYVPGSHRITPGREAWEKRMSLVASRGADRLTGRGSFRVREEDLADMGYPPPRALAVPANSLIVADTGGFHARGPSAGPGMRVEIWAYGRRNPFFTLPFDLWRIQALGLRRATLAWAAGDWLERRGLKPQVWRQRPGVSAFDPAE
ncbi:phytanoyl-CoA dioxygenase family protein [Acidomonas methanolica]|uniref:phytanoyl-CoA dioxygenase family protein n=1 Tax=Acidomonas methanolica TaxID=437 RepID=UPI002119EFF2|nr:phytanoyl-CoA dioxygenase family protein [Acidomonas methanolica]MCQ9155105.1 phytanoyl-CoA dioxygenase family protein [Acidomonas methanolica]